MEPALMFLVLNMGVIIASDLHLLILALWTCKDWRNGEVIHVIILIHFLIYMRLKFNYYIK